jgi:hypothetical protein
MNEPTCLDPWNLLPGLPDGFDRGGCTLPRLGDAREIALGEASRAELVALGIALRRPPGPGCRLVLDGRTRPQKLVLDLAKAQGCTLVLCEGARLTGTVTASGDGHVLAVGGQGGRACHLNVTFRGHHALVVLGEGLSSRGVDLLAEGPEGSILVGDDAMFSIGISIRTSDSHAILDIASRRQVNPPEPVVVGPHVWMGEGSTLLPGVRVGTGSIVAMKSLVTRPVPARTLVGGIPARVLRQGVTWSRSSRPDAAAIARTIAELPDMGDDLAEPS